MKLSNFLISFLLTILVVSTFFTIYYNYSITKNELLNKIYDHLTTTSESRTDTIKVYFKEELEKNKIMGDSAVFRTFLSAYANGSLPSDSNKQEVMKRLVGIQNLSSEYNEAFLLDNKGKIVASSNSNSIGRDKSLDSYFINSKEKSFIKDPYFRDDTGKIQMAVSSPLFDSKKQFIGIYVVRLNMDKLNEILSKRAGLGESGEIVLVNSDKYAISNLKYYENAPLNLKIETKITQLCMEDLEGSSNEDITIEKHESPILLYKDYRGVDVLGTHSYVLPYAKWCLISKIDKSEAIDEPLNNLLRTSIFSGFILIFFVSILTLILSRKISSSLNKLSSSVSEITKGNFDVQLERSGIFEVQSLIDSLNRILASLKLAILRVGLTKEALGLTEVVKAKEEAEDKYKVIYEGSSDAIMTLESPTWKFSAGNPSAIKMFNAKDEKDLTSRAPWEFSPEKQPDGQLSSVKAKKMIEKAMKEGSNYFEWTHKRLNGENFPATVLLSRIKEKDKTYLQATVRDITGIKNQENKFEELFNSLSDSVFIHDLNANFLEVNKSAEKELGYTKEQFKKMKVYQIDSPKFKKLIKSRIDELKKKGEVTFESAHISKTRKEIPVQIHSKVIKYEGKPAILSIARKIR